MESSAFLGGYNVFLMLLKISYRDYRYLDCMCGDLNSFYSWPSFCSTNVVELQYFCHSTDWSVTLKH